MDTKDTHIVTHTVQTALGLGLLPFPKHTQSQHSGCMMLKNWSSLALHTGCPLRRKGTATASTTPQAPNTTQLKLLHKYVN
jgi:hypothetical protein